MRHRSGGMTRALRCCCGAIEYPLRIRCGSIAFPGHPLYFYYTIKSDNASFPGAPADVNLTNRRFCTYQKALSHDS